MSADGEVWTTDAYKIALNGNVDNPSQYVGHLLTAEYGAEIRVSDAGWQCDGDARARWRVQRVVSVDRVKQKPPCRKARRLIASVG